MTDSGSPPVPSVAEALQELKRIIREADTLPELPAEPDYEVLAVAYANALLQVNDRQRRIVTVLEAMEHEHVTHHRQTLSLLQAIRKGQQPSSNGH